MHASRLSTFFLSFFLCTTFSSVTIFPSTAASAPALVSPPLREEPPSEFLPSAEPCFERRPERSLCFLFDFRLRVANRLIYPLPCFPPGPIVVDRFLRGELETGPFGISALSLAGFFLAALATSGSSIMGTTSAISSGLRLSSLGALSEPADEVDSPSVWTSECCLSTLSRAFLI